MIAMKNKPTYSIREVCEMTNISRAWISRLCADGVVGQRKELPFAPGYHYVLSESDVKQLRENTVIRKSQKN